MTILPHPPPADFEDQLRAAILEAEQHAAEHPTDASRFYAMGLRTAAGLYGMAEGADPDTRARNADLERAGFVPAFLPDGSVNPAAAQPVFHTCGMPGLDHRHPSRIDALRCSRSRRTT